MSMREEVIHAIFLDLHKLYGNLDRARLLKILEGYGVGPRSLCLLCRYWDRLQMVERVGEYYGETFRGERGMMQGDPIYPTISNMVVGAMVRQWVSLVAEGDGIDDKENSNGYEAAQPER